MFNHKLLLKPALAGLVIGAGLVTSAYAIGLERQDAEVLRGTPQGEPTQQAAVIPAPPAAASNHAAPQSEFPNAKVTIGPVVYVSATEHRAQPAPCTERWRALESGPVGRYVLDTCPGAPAPPPPRRRPRAPGRPDPAA